MLPHVLMMLKFSASEVGTPAAVKFFPWVYKTLFQRSRR